MSSGYPVGAFPRSNKKVSRRRRRRRRQMNMPINGNFQPDLSQIPNQQMYPDTSYMQSPTQQFYPSQQQLPIQAEQLNPTLNANYYQMPSYPTSAIFQDGQVYQTMDPQFTIQVQISAGSNGNGK